MGHHTALRSAFALVVTLLLSATTQAQLFRVYLAPTGSDSNPCTLPAPCRLLPAALAAVADGGGIWMLDPANYSTASVNITKSVTILAVPGVVGSVDPTGMGGYAAITIANPGAKVWASGNNAVRNNGTNKSGTITVASPLEWVRGKAGASRRDCLAHFPPPAPRRIDPKVNVLSFTLDSHSFRSAIRDPSHNSA